ncbi:SpoIIE family protein phosphatase [Lentisphaera profundi]|uniref:SpoIIE family protein phosphatase n=1 Tax=Lentisphaera profundi TaxID=1658616 RepID=A0ABY7VXA7_9BACT|nr:GAF domain-containing SpoIIE family protein phosphatase [Lentisphaera profundi]WDE96703.1 SpoIIE family protein phosphatase [Lentisphaera profundi]
MEIFIYVLLGIVIGILVVIHALKIRELQEANRRYCEDRKAVANFLNRFAHSVAMAGGNIDSTMVSLGRFIVSTIHAESLCIFFMDEEGKTMEAVTSIGPFPSMSAFEGGEKTDVASIRERKVIVGEGFFGKISKNMKPALIGKFELSESQVEAGIKSLMVVPIVLFNEMQGIICAVNSEGRSGRFEQDDLELFASLAVVATLSKNMIETYGQMADQQRMQQELEFARQIQQTLTPVDMPNFAHLDIFAHNIPAKEVSGDFYDFIKIDEHRTLFVLADASGKGLPACLIMIMTRSVLRAICSRFTDMESLLLELNQYLVQDTDMERFVTMIFCLADSRNNTMEMARAGHTEVLLKNDKGEVFEIVPEGPAIGLIPNEMGVSFDTFSMAIQDGFCFLFYTDGLTEAENEDGLEYGLPRLKETWCHHTGSSKGQATGLLNDIQRFTGDYPQSDDQTIMIMSVSELNRD